MQTSGSQATPVASMLIPSHRDLPVDGPPRSDTPHVRLLAQENAVLTRQLADVQQRVTRQAVQQARRIQVLQADLMRLHAAIISRDTALLMLREDMAVLQGGATCVPSCASLNLR